MQKKLGLTSATALLFSLLVTCAHAQAPHATLLIVVKGEQAVPAGATSVYVSDEHIHRFIMTDAKGAVSINLPAGTYTVSAAKSVNVGGMLDRFAAPEAQVHVGAGDLSSVVLRLAALPNPMSSIDLATLRKMGVDPEIAKDLN